MKDFDDQLRALGRRALRILRHENAVLDIFLVSGVEMKRIEKEYLGTHRGEVDVLSFPEVGDFPHPRQKKKLLGEVYLNRDIARRDAERVKFLLVHAVLHLLGYTHEKERDRIEMVKREKELCAQLRVVHPEVDKHI